MSHRPSSGSSARSRRDEVWEMKRQRFIAKKQAEANGGYVRQQAPVHCAPQFPNSQPPDSPDSLSQLVKGSYNMREQPQQQASLHHPYGERPSSGSRGSQGNQVYSAGGFDRETAGQWNTNVQQTRLNQQNRHDPNISGPSMPSGGQRVTQAPGGGSSIDLGWSGNSSRPPQMPGSGGKQGPSPSHGRGNFAAPWGREDDNLPSRQTPSQRSSCPFGTDTTADYPVRNSARSNSRGRANSPMNRVNGELPTAGFAQPRSQAGPFGNEVYTAQNIPQAPMQTGARSRGVSPMNGPFGNDAPPAGFSRGGAYGRQAPGGNSQVVFG